MATEALPLSFIPSPSLDAAQGRLQALVARLGDGDVVAFEDLYRLTRQDTARALALLLGARADFENLIQDCYLRLFRVLRAGRAEASVPLSLSLYRVCAEVALTQLRWWSRRPAVHDEPGGPESELQSEARQAARVVQSALVRLEARQRVVFVYHELLGLSLEDIAVCLGMSVAGVKARLASARALFTAEVSKQRRSAAEEV